jgi:hypothetical protein
VKVLRLELEVDLFIYNNDPLYVTMCVPVAAGGITGGRNYRTTINQNIDPFQYCYFSYSHLWSPVSRMGCTITTTKRGKAGETYSEL